MFNTTNIMELCDISDGVIYTPTRDILEIIVKYISHSFTEQNNYMRFFDESYPERFAIHYKNGSLGGYCYIEWFLGNYKDKSTFHMINYAAKQWHTTNDGRHTYYGYKAGDIVKINKHLVEDKIYGNCQCTTYQKQQRGRVAVIEQVLFDYDDSNEPSYYVRCQMGKVSTTPYSNLMFDDVYLALATDNKDHLDVAGVWENSILIPKHSTFEIPNSVNMEGKL